MYAMMKSMMKGNRNQTECAPNHLEHTSNTKGNIEMATQLTPADLAERFNSDPKTIRRFLRSLIPADNRPGKGRRWVLSDDKKTMDALHARFTAWSNKATKVISLDDLTDDSAES